jgi:hypothetical protein
MATNPDPRFTYAAATCATDTAEGVPVVMRRGDPWDASDPFCLAHADLFVADVTAVGPDFPRRTVPAADVPPVSEQHKTRRLRRR